MRMLRHLLTVLLLVLASAGSATAFNPDEVLDDPALEARARTLSLEFRCLVCQNQSIDDSNAELAHGHKRRRAVRRRAGRACQTDERP